MEKTYKVIRSDTLSSQFDVRFVVVDENGVILDDAQGYGYKSIRNAHAGFAYKNRDKRKDGERIHKELVIQKWMDEHTEFVEMIETVSFEIAKGSWGKEACFDTKMLKYMLTEWGYNDLPFSVSDLYKFWLIGPIYSKKKKNIKGT